MSAAASLPDLPPTADELPYSFGEPLESHFHRLQMNLLVDSLDLHLRQHGRSDFFVGGNMALYYSLLQVKKNDFRGPDVFVVLGTERRARKSWVVWDEDGQTPDVIIELLSDSTAAMDRGDKKRIYGKLLKVPEYYLFDPATGELEGYRLATTPVEYEPLTLISGERLVSKALDLELGVWHGAHLGYESLWLRWYQSDGQLIPSQEEIAAEAERQKAEAERQKAELAERLAIYERRFGPL